MHELFLPHLFLKLFFSCMPVLPLKKKQINIYFTKKKLQRIDSPTEMFLLLCIVVNRQNNTLISLGTLKCDPINSPIPLCGLHHCLRRCCKYDQLITRPAAANHF